MNGKIEALISQHEQDGDFTHMKLTDRMLEDAQAQLELTIPTQFVDFLNAYSHGGIGGVEILGVGLTGTMVFLEATLRARKYGLPQNLLVVEDCDEWLYCIDCDSSKVVSWSQVDGIREEYPDFDTFLLQDLEDAVENL